MAMSWGEQEEEDTDVQRTKVGSSKMAHQGKVFVIPGTYIVEGEN